MADLKALSTEELINELASRIDTGHKLAPIAFSEEQAERFRKADVITIAEQEFSLISLKRLIDAFVEIGVSNDKPIHFFRKFKGS